MLIAAHSEVRRYLPEQKVTGQNGKVTAAIPELRPRGHAEFIRQNIAFKMRRAQ
jgi:hypothetical protein